MKGLGSVAKNAISHVSGQCSGHFVIFLEFQFQFASVCTTMTSGRSFGRLVERRKKILVKGYCVISELEAFTGLV